MATEQLQSPVDTPETAITRVAKEAGVNPQFLLGLARLETAGGAKTIKGDGKDTFNLFNIKGQGPKGGISAFDKAEGSNDPYRAYNSYEESARDAIKFLQNKRYAGALQAKDGTEFATILKTGGYATDPNYVAKLSGVIGATVPGTQTVGTPVTVTKPDGTTESRRLARDSAAAATMFEGVALRNALQDDAPKYEQQAIDNEPKFEETPGFTDLVGTAWQDPRVIPTRTLLEHTFRAIDGSEDPVVEGWSYFNDRAAIEGKLRNQDEIDYVRENGMSSPAALDRAMAEIDNRRRYDAEYAKGGPTLAFAAQLTAGLADPASLLAGLGLSKAFQLGRIGSGAYIASGRGGAAVAAAGAENALGNLAIEAAADIAGEVKSASDYALAAVTGAGLSTLFARGTLRAANEAAQANLLKDMGDKAIADHAAVVQQARTELGDDATPEQIQAKVTELQTTQIKADLDEATSTKPYTDDMAVDKDTLALMKDDFEGKPPVTENKLDAEADALKVDGISDQLDYPVDAKDPVALIDAVRTIETDGVSKPIVRTIQTTEGDALTTTWSYGKKKAGEDTSALTVLTTLSKVNKKMSKVQRVIVDRLAETIKGSPAMTKVNFALSYKRGWYNPPNSASGKKAGGAFITTPSGKTSGTENLGAIAANLDGHALYTVVHEITHAATHAKIEAGRTGKGTAEEIGSFQRLDAMRLQMIEKLKAEGTMPKNKKEADSSQGPAYASQNVHEFVAQAYSDEAMQKFLAGMKGNGGNALQKFVQEVRRLLGLGKERTLLDDVLGEIDDMILLPESSPLKKSNKKVMGIKQLLSESPAFIEWFGKSKMFDVVDGVKVPKVFYHGTGWTFKVFDPNVSNSVKASFVSPSPKFAQGFTSNGTKMAHILKMDGTGYYTLEQIAEFERRAKVLKDSGKTAYSYNSLDGLTKELMINEAPSGNIMAVFVRSENPFDYENPDQINAIRSQIISQRLADGHDIQSATSYAKELMTELTAPKDGTTNWPTFENKELQKALKALKHDSWFEMEGKTKNLAVYDANQIKSAIGNNGDYSTANDDILAGALPGPSTSSNQAATGASIWLPRIIDHARNWTAKNPVDKKKLATFTRAIGSEGTLGGGYSDGLKLASSMNPIMRMIAGLVVETTTGAAGRRTTAAVARELLHRKFIGNTLLDYDGAYAGWAKSQGIGATKRFLNDVNQGDLKRKFDNAVYREILNRRNKLPLSQDPNVKGAADSLEGGFTRMLNEQKGAGVLGGDNLPGDSVGYVPQALDGKKLAVATDSQLKDLEANLAEQFKANTDWDEAFADTFAAYYVKRARDRAMGAKGIDGLAAGHDGLTHVHELLTELGDDVPALKDAANKAKALALQKSGLGQTKKRLDIDLTSRLKDGTEVMDFYVTDPLLLYRQYANRTAGNVALTRQGILGPKGVRQLREAAQSLAGGERATKDEFDAFDRVMAEMLGQPDPGGVVSAGATNLRLLVSLQRLGGLAFTQAAETFNAVHHLGLGAVLKGIPDLPRLIGEVRSIKSGRKVKSPLLESIETYSGAEFGAENYKMVAPLDAPDNRLVEYGDTAGLGSRLLNAGVHLQSKVSFFRGLMSAQHRMMAEQIVLKSLRYIAEGKNPAALVDMGFTDRVVNGMKGDLAQAVTYGPDGRIKEFDITKVSDPRVREEFIQAVHRGVSQIIQGTFVGERSAWASNDYAKLFLQLRTFGLTAVEKQWGRTRMNEGYAKAAGLLLGQMALAAPIHLARVQIGAAGREDRDEYLERNLSPGGLVRALMNYSSLSGMTGDILELTTSAAGGWAGEDFKQFMGVGNQSTSVGRAVPAAGTIDSAFKLVSGKLDLHTAVKQLPFSNLPFLTPIINLTKTED